MFPNNTRILVVDDSENIRELLKRELATIGFEGPFPEAATGDEGYRVVQAAMDAGQPFQLIISDWNMPGMSGIDFLKKLRAIPEFAMTPFLLVTSEASADQVLEAAAAGVSNYIVKPFNAQTLKEKLQSVYKKHFPGR